MIKYKTNYYRDCLSDPEKEAVEEVYSSSLTKGSIARHIALDDLMEFVGWYIQYTEEEIQNVEMAKYRVKGLVFDIFENGFAENSVAKGSRYIYHWMVKEGSGFCMTTSFQLNKIEEESAL